MVADSSPTDFRISPDLRDSMFDTRRGRWNIDDESQNNTRVHNENMLKQAEDNQRTTDAVAN